jgi:hypothetical protein
VITEQESLSQLQEDFARCGLNPARAEGARARFRAKLCEHTQAAKRMTERITEQERATAAVQAALPAPIVDSFMAIIGRRGGSSTNPFLKDAAAPAAPETRRDSLTEVVKPRTTNQASLRDLLSGRSEPPTNRDTFYALLEGRK